MAERSAQSPSLAKNFFMQNGQKLTNLFQKNISPQKSAFFFGGGSGDRWSLRTMCLGLAAACDQEIVLVETILWRTRKKKKVL